MHVRATAAVFVLVWVSAAQAQQVPPVSERVEVARILIDVRVTDGRGEPVRDLGPSDFEVRVGRRAARVESALWVAGELDRESGIGPVESADGADVRLGAPRAEGRLIVFVIQKSLEGSRIVGLMRMLTETRSFLDTFTPRDRIAIVSFDTHLALRLDFTGDLDRVRHALERGALLGRPGPWQASPDVSLLPALDPAAARRASTMEQALLLLGQALRPLPGAKAVVILGHGFGTFGPTGVTFDVEYDEARQLLQEARAAVFCFDVTDADYHSLEVGLQAVAEDTGGFYERTHLFSKRGLDRLAGVLAGHYVLFVERPELEPGRHPIRVKLHGRKGEVLASRAVFTAQP